MRRRWRRVPPADIFDPRYAGVMPLLRDGAFPLMSHEDILMSYYSHYPQYLVMQETGVKPSERLVFSDDSMPAGSPDAASLIRPTGSFREEVQRAAHEYLEEKQQPEPQSTDDDRPLPEDAEAAAVVRYLRAHGDTYADDIAAALDMDLSVLLSTLTELELDGFAESLFGKQYRAV